jgi:DUF1680 family protein
MLGGYTWTANVDDSAKKINLDVYLFVAASRKISLPNGQAATARLRTEMPWQGQVALDLDAPEGWSWNVRLPEPDYAADIQISSPVSDRSAGFASTSINGKGTVDMSFDLPVRLLSSHPLTGQDTLTVSRGPIVYTAESVDNASLEKEYKHFEGLGIKSSARFETKEMEIEGIPVVSLTTDEVFACEGVNSRPSYSVVGPKQPARKWQAQQGGLVLVPWFARANRGGAGHVRTAFLRAD